MRQTQKEPDINGKLFNKLWRKTTETQVEDFKSVEANKSEVNRLRFLLKKRVKTSEMTKEDFWAGQIKVSGVKLTGKLFGMFVHSATIQMRSYKNK